MPAPAGTPLNATNTPWKGADSRYGNYTFDNCAVLLANVAAYRLPFYYDQTIRSGAPSAYSDEQYINVGFAFGGAVVLSNEPTALGYTGTSYGGTLKVTNIQITEFGLEVRDKRGCLVGWEVVNNSDAWGIDLDVLVEVPG